MNEITSSRPLSDLHDATLVEIVLLWERGELRVSARVRSEEPRTVTLVLSGLRWFECPRREPWGHSVSINEVRVGRTSSTSRLEIEMQSGDTLVAEAERIDLGIATSGEDSTCEHS